MQDFYILQNPLFKRSREDALAGKKPIRQSLLIPAYSLQDPETGASVFDDQTVNDLLLGGKQDEFMDPRIVSQFDLRNGDLITLGSGDKLLCINGIPIEKFQRTRPKFAYPNRRIPFLDNNPVLAKATYRAPWGFGQRGVIIAKPGKGKSTYGWALIKEGCGYTLVDPNFSLVYISVDERGEDATEGEDMVNTFDHRPGSVMTFSLPANVIAASQWFQSWYACEIAESLALAGKDVMVIIDAASRLLGSIADPEIVKPKNDAGVSKGATKFELLNVRRLILAKGGRVRFGPGSYTAALIMLTGEANFETLLYDMFGAAIETSLWVVRDIGQIDIEATRTRQVDRILHDHDPFTALYRRMEIMRMASWSEDVMGKSGTKSLQTFTPNLAEQNRRHEEMVKAVLTCKSQAEKLNALEVLAKKWHLLLELNGAA